MEGVTWPTEGQREGGYHHLPVDVLERRADHEAWMVKRGESVSLGGHWLKCHGLSVESDLLGLSFRVPRVAPSLQTQAVEPVVASYQDGHSDHAARPSSATCSRILKSSVIGSSSCSLCSASSSARCSGLHGQRRRNCRLWSSALEGLWLGGSGLSVGSEELAHTAKTAIVTELASPSCSVPATRPLRSPGSASYDATIARVWRCTCHCTLGRGGV